MFVRWPAGLSRFARRCSPRPCVPGFGCVAVHDPDSVPVWNQKPEEHIQLTDAEEMIDELDRILTDIWNDQRQDSRRLGSGSAGEIPLRIRAPDGANG